MRERVVVREKGVRCSRRLECIMNCRENPYDVEFLLAGQQEVIIIFQNNQETPHGNIF